MENRLSITAVSFTKLFPWASLTKRRAEGDLAPLTEQGRPRLTMKLPLLWMLSSTWPPAGREGWHSCSAPPTNSQVPTKSPRVTFPTLSGTENKLLNSKALPHSSPQQLVPEGAGTHLWHTGQ